MRFLPIFTALLAFWLGASPGSRGWAQDMSRALAGELPKTPSENLPLLPAPPGMLLDQAGVFPPEMAARLAAILQKARADDVWVYVLTVPSLRVLPSKQQEELETQVKRYVAAWLPRTVGAMVLFDDEGGLMSIETSAEANRRFSDIQMQIELVDPLAASQLEGLSREKLEKGATIVVQVLTRLQAKYRQEVRRQKIANTLMAVLAIVGVALLIRSATAEGKKGEPETDVSETDVPDRPPPAV